MTISEVQLGSQRDVNENSIESKRYPGGRNFRYVNMINIGEGQET
jgi:hypothetical protein